MRVWWAAPVLLSVGLSGCGAIGAIGLNPFGKKETSVVTNVSPAPVGSVESAELPPTDGPSSGNSEVALNETGLGTPPSANGAPLTAGAQVSRTDLLGGWTLTNGKESCQLFMTLTSWTGGYRASTQGCASPALKSISAWNLEANQIVLAGAGGARLAQLAAAAQGRFEGQLVGTTTTVSFYR